MYTAIYGVGDGFVVWAALDHTTASSFGPCRHLGPVVSQPFSAILGVFWWGKAILGVFGGVTAQKTARLKCASLWTSGHILWAATARTTAPSCGRFSADPLSKIQIF